MDSQDYISKLADVVNLNLDSKIKNRLSQPEKDVKMIIEELKNVLEQARMELDDIKRVKAVLISEILSEQETTRIPEISFEKVENDCKIFLENLRKREIEWEMEEDRIRSERILYESKILELKKIGSKFLKDIK